MSRNKAASLILGLVLIAGFLPLLVASWLSGRDVQLELAEVCIELWRQERET